MDRTALMLPSFPRLLPTQHGAKAEVYFRTPVHPARWRRSGAQRCGGAGVRPTQQACERGRASRPLRAQQGTRSLPELEQGVWGKHDGIALRLPQPARKHENSFLT